MSKISFTYKLSNGDLIIEQSMVAEKYQFYNVIGKKPTPNRSICSCPAYILTAGKLSNVLTSLCPSFFRTSFLFTSLKRSIH